MPQTTITAEYRHDRYIKDDLADQSWGIYVLHDDDHGSIVALGELPKTYREPGTVLSLHGTWGNDPKWGEQFKFLSAVPQRPKGKFATIKFLQVASGIGPVTARSIWNHFGEDAIDTLANEPEKVKEKLSRVSFDLEEASRSMKEILQDADRKGPLVSLFAGIAFPSALVNQVLTTFRGDPVATIRKNPFSLIGCPRVGFLLCDELRAQLNLPQDMPERLEAAAVHAMKSHTNQVWVQKLIAYTSFKDLTGFRRDRAEQVYRSLYQAGKIAYHEEHFALARDYEDEQEVCRHMIRLSSGGSMMDWTIDGEELTAHQFEQLHQAKCNGGVAYLLGGAGTGKTFSLKAIVSTFDPFDVVACSPTGKAAQRMFQSLKEHGITSIQPKTIHSTLEARPDMQGGWEFAIDGVDNFLECKLLIVDEVSMLDNKLACQLFRAVRSGTLVLLVGDPHQLSPVGKGTLLRDWQLWCDEHKNLGTYGLLTKVHRNQGKIIGVCEQIYQGKTPVVDFGSKIPESWDKDSNLVWLSWRPARPSRTGTRSVTCSS